MDITVTVVCKGNETVQQALHRFAKNQISTTDSAELIITQTYNMGEYPVVKGSVSLSGVKIARVATADVREMLEKDFRVDKFQLLITITPQPTIS